jgi:glucose-6-phosphate 1-dehydrogenase
MNSAAPLKSGILVIFGITGDLTRKKLLPALYHLVSDNLLPEHFEIVGATRRGIAVSELLAGVRAEITGVEGKCDQEVLDRLGAMMRVVKMDMTSGADYHELKAALDKIEDDHQACLNRLFYLSIPPTTYGPVVDLLGSSGLGRGCQHGSADSRIMVEKPFGYDLASAEELIHRLKQNFTESQIYRIDHYLAKETAQNIMIFRFANPIFEAVWDRESVDRIVVSASESIGIEGRAGFYEPTGALRDLIQSHLIQVLALVTMEQPAAMTAANVHQEKLKLLDAIRPIAPDQVAKRAMRGQYEGYRDEVDNPTSFTETFARIELEIDNHRWKGVPIIIQTGKRLDRKSTDIVMQFGSNNLTFRLQPDEGIGIDLLAKKPGFNQDTEAVKMTFDYHHSFGEGIHPDAYERVLMDGIRGDQTLFATSDEVLAAWRVVEPVVQAWSKGGQGLTVYQPGSNPSDITHPFVH